MTTLADIVQARVLDTRYRRLVSAVCAAYGIAPEVIQGRQRARRIARARQIVMHLATTDLGLSTVVVGRLLGGRDHSTVIHGRDTIAGLVETNSAIRERFDRIRREVFRE